MVSPLVCHLFAMKPDIKRILAVDPGSVRIGIALSDPSATIANPLTILEHVSRPVDAGQIAQLAGEHAACLIVVGVTYAEDGQLSPEGRRGARLADAIRAQTEIPVKLWDEGGSTQAARTAQIQLGSGRKKRRGHLDDLAAAYMLQTYLDAQADADD